MFSFGLSSISPFLPSLYDKKLFPCCTETITMFVCASGAEFEKQIFQLLTVSFVLFEYNTDEVSNYFCRLYPYYFCNKQNHSNPSFHIECTCRITVIIVPPGFNISVVSGCLLKGSVSEFNKWRMMTALSIILPLVGRMTGSRMSVIISGSVINNRNIYDYKPCCQVALLKREDELGFASANHDPKRAVKMPQGSPK